MGTRQVSTLIIFSFLLPLFCYCSPWLNPTNHQSSCMHAGQPSRAHSRVQGREGLERQKTISGTAISHSPFGEIMTDFLPSHKVVISLLAENLNYYFKFSCSNVFNLIKTQYKTATQALTQEKQHKHKRLLLSCFSFFLLIFIWHLFISLTLANTLTDDIYS